MSDRGRTFLVATTIAVVVALAGGCTGDGGGGGTAEPPQKDVLVVDSKACEEVRTGIEAFNLGDYDGTVEHFETALPLAEGQDDGSQRAMDLVEAVRYYAELDAEQYPEAARSSPAFAKYKAITLGQCMPVGSETSESPGTDI